MPSNLADDIRAGTPSEKSIHGDLSSADWQSIRAAHEAWKHEFREVDGTWHARNPGQQWTTRFDGRGFLAQPEGAGWKWGLELRSYGFDGAHLTVGGQPEIRAVGQRLSYHWEGGLEEWFINDNRGLEHGFIVAERPPGGDAGTALVFALATRGGLQPSVSSDARTIHFRDEAGAPVLNYAGLKVWDADGRILPARFEADGGGEFRITVNDTGARYPITVDPIAQQAYLKASNTEAGDNFGVSVAVSGDTVVVGAHAEDSITSGVNSTPNNGASDSGAAYVFVRSGTTWSQQAYLKAPNPTGSEYFGISVAVSGDTVVVGASGEDSSTTGVNSTPNNGAQDSGAAYVFVRSGTTWSQQAYLKASNTGAGDVFGRSVAVSGDTVVVGAWGEDSSTTGVDSTPNESAANSGAAYVFVRSGTTWSQQAYLKAANAGIGHFFGISVAVSGDTVVVGARDEASGTSGVNSTPTNVAPGSGAAYVFVRSGATWSQQAYLKASNTEVYDAFGNSVAVSGDTVVVGARGEDSGTTGVNSTPTNVAPGSGAAYVFARSGTTWSQQAYLKASNTEAGDNFGVSVAVSGDTVVVGAHTEDSSTSGVNSTPNNGASDSGAAYVFVRSGTTWSQQAYLKASNTGGGDDFGYSVAMSGDTVVVGAWDEDSSTTGVNSTPNESASNSGAAYIFTGFGPVSPEIAVEHPLNTNVPNAGSVGFGVVTVGGAGDRIFTVRNAGDGTLQLTGSPRVAISGPDAAHFSVPSQPAGSVAAGGNSTFTVRFAPTSHGTKNATLTIANDDSDENPFTIQVSGKANRAPTFSSVTLNTTFGALLEVPISTILAGASDPDGDSLTVLSAGPGTSAGGGLSLTPVSTLVYTPPAKFAGTDTFSVTYADPDGATVVGTVSVIVQPIDVTLNVIGSNGTVTISPTKSVYQTGDTVTLTAVPASGFDFSGWFGALSGNTNPSTFVLEGDTTVYANFVGKPGNLSVEQSGAGTTSLNFDSRRLGAGPVPMTVVLRNSGQGTIFNLSLALTGAAAGDYTLVGPVPQSLAPGEQANLTVSFSPRGPGGREAMLTINGGSALPTPLNVNLSGAGVADTAVPTLVKDIRTGSASSSPYSLTAVGSRVFFVANDGVHGWELWVSDGTPDGTSMVADLAPGAESGAPSNLVAVGETLFFTATVDGVQEIWRTDGTETGTYPVFTVVEGWVGQLTALFGKLYFANYFSETEMPAGAIYPITTKVLEVWSSDGTVDGIDLRFSRVIDNYNGGSAPNEIGLELTGLTSAHGAIYFVVRQTSQSWSGGYSEERLFRVGEPGPGGEYGIGSWSASLPPGPGSSAMPMVGNFAEMGGSLFFHAPGIVPPFGGPNPGPALWRVDAGSSATMVKGEIHTFSQISSTPGTSNMLAVGSRLFFSGKRQIDMDPTLWTSDGTAEGTGPVVTDQTYGTTVSTPWGFTRFGDRVFFSAQINSASDVEPWIADAALSEVRRIRDIRPGNVASLPLHPVVRAGAVFFTADDGVNGRQIWKTFGTEASTMRLADTFGGGAGLTVDGVLVGAGAKIFFVAPAAGVGNELHVLDLGVQSREQIGEQIAGELVSAGLPPEQAAPEAEPFGDGVSNLLKFAFNMNLAGPDSTQLTPGEGNSGLPAVGVSETPAGEPLFQVEFIRRKDSGLIYVPKVSTNLRDFTPMTGTVTVTPIDGEWERVTVSEPYPEGPRVRRFSVIEVYLP